MMDAVSKAFTKEESEPPLVVRRRATLPEGVPNYVTASGLAAYRRELSELKGQRAALAQSADNSDPDTAPAHAPLNARIAELEATITSAELVDGAALPGEQVRFGASVRVRTATGAERTYRIVGVDEADAALGRIAFIAPIARALLGQRVGDSVVVRTPHGEDELEVLALHYE